MFLYLPLVSVNPSVVSGKSYISAAVVLAVRDDVCILFAEKNISYGAMNTASNFA